MLPVWMPDRILETNASIGNVLTGLEINNALIAERVTILKEYPFIGVMGYAAGENPFSYPEKQPYLYFLQHFLKHRLQML